MPEKIRTIAGQLKEFIQKHINNEMDADTLNEYKNASELADSLIGEDKVVEDEIKSYKDTIVKMVKTSGSGDTPKDPTQKEESQPRGLEEIAKSVVSGGK